MPRAEGQERASHLLVTGMAAHAPDRPAGGKGHLRSRSPRPEAAETPTGRGATWRAGVSPGVASCAKAVAVSGVAHCGGPGLTVPGGTDGTGRSGPGLSPHGTPHPRSRPCGTRCTKEQAPDLVLFLGS